MGNLSISHVLNLLSVTLYALECVLVSMRVVVDYYTSTLMAE